MSVVGISTCDLKFLAYYRLMQILRFLAPGLIKYVRRKNWKRSSAMNYCETGGYFSIHTNGSTQTLDLHLLFRPFIELFYSNSKSVYKCEFKNKTKMLPGKIFQKSF